jgi:hypothetical protein
LAALRGQAVAIVAVRAVWADAAGEGAGDVAGAAADVHDSVIEADAEQLGGGRPEPLDGRHRCLLVERCDEDRGVGVGVDRVRQLMHSMDLSVAAFDSRVAGPW